MDYQTIILEKRGNIAVLTLNRPERLNAINPQMTGELISALRSRQTAALLCCILLGFGTTTNYVGVNW